MSLFLLIYEYIEKKNYAFYLSQLFYWFIIFVIWLEIKI